MVAAGGVDRMRALTAALLLALLGVALVALAGDEQPVKHAPHRVLVLGDGLGVPDLGPSLVRQLEARGEVEVLLGPAGPTGLMLPGALDWVEVTKAALDAHRPDVVLLVAGRDDRRAPMTRAGKKARAPGGGRLKDPAALYRTRVDELLAVPAGLPVFVAAAPPVKAAAARRFPFVPGTLELACGAQADCTFLPDPFADPAGEAAAAIVAGMEGRISWERAPEPVPTPPPSRWNDDGELLLPAEFTESELRSHHSKARGRDVQFWAFVPRPERPDDDFPVLYLLHGAWGGQDDWRQHARAQLEDLAERYGVIVVTPDGDPFGWYLDSPVDADSAIETWLIHELIPHIEASDLPVMRGPEHRSIAGLSMGGHGAFVLALRNPGTFASTSSMSGILDITTHPKSWELPERLGPLSRENRPLWEAHSATLLLRDMAEPPLPLLFTVTTGDSAAYAENLALHEELGRREFPHEYTEEAGGHTWDYWSSIIDEHVAFHAEYLSGDGVR